MYPQLYFCKSFDTTGFRSEGLDQHGRCSPICCISSNHLSSVWEQASYQSDWVLQLGLYSVERIDWCSRSRRLHCVVRSFYVPFPTVTRISTPTRSKRCTFTNHFAHTSQCSGIIRSQCPAIIYPIRFGDNNGVRNNDASAIPSRRHGAAKSIKDILCLPCHALTAPSFSFLQLCYGAGLARFQSTGL